MPPKAAPPIELTQPMIEAIVEWEKTKKELDRVKAEELAQRLHLMSVIPFNADKEEGGQTVKLGAGWKLALDKPIDYKMDTKNNETVSACLQALSVVNPAAMTNIVRWEPVMSVSAYKALTDAEKKIIAPVVTIKPGTPTLELKRPPVPKA